MREAEHMRILQTLFDFANKPLVFHLFLQSGVGLVLFGFGTIWFSTRETAKWKISKIILGSASSFAGTSLVIIGIIFQNIMG